MYMNRPFHRKLTSRFQFSSRYASRLELPVGRDFLIICLQAGYKHEDIPGHIGVAATIIKNLQRK